MNKAISNIDYIIKKELPKTTKVNCNLEQIKQFDLEKINERIEKENKKNILIKKNNFDNLYQQRERNEFFYKCKKKMNLMSLLNSKNELIQLFKELKQEFENFLSEEKIERNFPQLNQISTISMDENSMGLILEAIISFICILDFGTTGTLSLLLGLTIYVFTGNKSKELKFY